MKVLLCLALFATYVLAGTPVIGTEAAIQVAQIGSTDIIRAIKVDWYPIIAPRLLDIQALQILKNGDAGRIDAVRFIINTIDDVGIFFQYFAAASNIPTGVPDPMGQAAVADFALYVKNLAVFEYVNNDGVLGYQPGGTDEITGIYILGHPDLQWKVVVFNSTVIQVPGGPNVTVSSAVWETLDGVFYIRFTIADYPIVYNGIRLSTNRIKIDTGIRWFENVNHVPANWTYGPSTQPNARVGMVVITAAFLEAAGIQIGTSNGANNGSITFANGGFGAALNYLTTAATSKNSATVFGTAAVIAHVLDAVDNITMVAAEELVAWSLKVIWFSFENIARPGEVFWDPDIGGEPASTAGTSANGATTTPIHNGAAKESVLALSVFFLAVFAMLF